MQTLHRVRDRLVAERTSLMNQIGSLLLERRHVIPQGCARLAAALADLLDGTEPKLSARMTMLVGDMRDRWRSLDARIASFDREFAQAAEQDRQARRLLIILGICALNATALVAAVGDAGHVRSWPQPGCVARSGTASGDDRRQALAAWQYQARRPQSAQTPDPRRPISHADTAQDPYPARRLATRAACPRAS